MKKLVQESKWSRSSPSVIVLVSENGNKGTLHKRAYKAKEKEPDRGRSDVYRESLVETRTTPGSLSETLQTTALPSSPLYLVPST